MDTATARRLLEAERERLQGTRSAAVGLVDEATQSEQSELSHIDQHPADVGSELGEREKQQAIVLQVDSELHELDAAFERLERGTYGVCETCGKPIPDARLEAMPLTRHCVEDQARADRQASLG